MIKDCHTLFFSLSELLEHHGMVIDQWKWRTNPSSHPPIQQRQGERLYQLSFIKKDEAALNIVLYSCIGVAPSMHPTASRRCTKTSLFRASDPSQRVLIVSSASALLTLSWGPTIWMEVNAFLPFGFGVSLRIFWTYSDGWLCVESDLWVCVIKNHESTKTKADQWQNLVITKSESIRNAIQ